MGFLGTPMGWIMKIIFDIVHNYGVALVLFTLVFKLALFPLAVSQQKNSAKMAFFQPKLKKLQQKYGKDKQRYNDEMMKLYEEEGYNPMSSCFPMVIQMVLLFGIIDVVYKPLKHLLSISTDVIAEATKVLTEAGVSVSSAELSIINIIQGNEVLGKNGEAIASTVFEGIFSADVISQIKDFDLTFLGLNLGVIPTFAFPLILVPIISGLTSLGVTIFSMRQNTANGMSQQQNMKGMKIMMYIMPLFSVFFAFQLAAGVGIYWIVSNVFSFVQAVVIYKVYSPQRLKAKLEAERELKKTKKKSKYQLALQEARKQQLEARGEKVTQEALDEAVKEDEAKNEMTASQRLALARKKMAEKYGDEY